jgi:hypothetical protein
MLPEVCRFSPELLQVPVREGNFVNEDFLHRSTLLSVAMLWRFRDKLRAFTATIRQVSPEYKNDSYVAVRFANVFPQPE